VKGRFGVLGRGDDRNIVWPSNSTEQLATPSGENVPDKV
jgi:hypothetical protein